MKNEADFEASKGGQFIIVKGVEDVLRGKLGLRWGCRVLQGYAGEYFFHSRWAR